MKAPKVTRHCRREYLKRKKTANLHDQEFHGTSLLRVQKHIATFKKMSLSAAKKQKQREKL